MKVASVNIATKQSVIYNGSPVETGIFKKPVGSSILLKKEGVLHDTVVDTARHGGVEKACYLYGLEAYQFWKDQYPNATWEFGMFGENITVRGLDEADISIGDVFRIGEAVVQVSQPRQPCYKLGFRFNDPSIVDKFKQAPYPGVYVRVLQEGNVSNNDTIQFISTSDSLTVLEIFQLLYEPEPNMEKVHEAIGLKHLSDSVKLYLQKKYNL